MVLQRETAVLYTTAINRANLMKFMAPDNSNSLEGSNVSQTCILTQNASVLSFVFQNNALLPRVHVLIRQILLRPKKGEVETGKENIFIRQPAFMMQSEGMKIN